MFRDGKFPAHYLWGLWSGLQGVWMQSPHGTRHGTLPGRARSLSHVGGPWPVEWHGPVAALLVPGVRLRLEAPLSHQGPAPDHHCSSGCSLLKAGRASLWIWFNHKEFHPKLARKQVIFSIRGQQMKKKVMSRKEWLCRNLAHSEEGWPPCLLDKMLGAK